MKNYIVRAKNYDSPLDFFNGAIDNFFKPLFFDEKSDVMKTDIKEIGNEYLLDIEIPGFDKNEISVLVENEYLTITAEKKECAENKNDGRYLRKERNVSCQRSFYVGDVKEQEIKAKYANGILTLNIPKQEEEKPKKHNVEIGD